MSLDLLQKYTEQYVTEEISSYNKNIRILQLQLGGLYHALKIKEEVVTQGWHKIDPYEDENSEFEKLKPSVFLYDNQIRDSKLCSKILVGYTAISRAAEGYDSFKKMMHPFIFGALLAIKNNTGLDYTDENLAGSHYLQIEKHPNGHYFKPCENAAALELRLSSQVFKYITVEGKK